MRNSLKNNTQEGKTKDFTYDWKAFTEEDFNALKNKCQEPYPSDDFAGRVRIGTIDIDIVVRNDGENNYPSFDYYLLGKEGEGHTEKGNIPYDFLDGVDFKAHQIDKMSYSDFKEAFEILCHDKTLSLKKEASLPVADWNSNKEKFDEWHEIESNVYDFTGDELKTHDFYTLAKEDYLKKYSSLDGLKYDNIKLYLSENPQVSFNARNAKYDLVKDFFPNYENNPTVELADYISKDFKFIKEFNDKEGFEFYSRKAIIDYGKMLDEAIYKVAVAYRDGVENREKLLEDIGDVYPNTYSWITHDDGSGHLESPEGKKLFEYDMSTREFWRLNDNGGIDESFYDYNVPFEDSKRRAESYIKENLEDNSLNINFKDVSLDDESIDDDFSTHRNPKNVYVITKYEHNSENDILEGMSCKKFFISEEEAYKSIKDFQTKEGSSYDVESMPVTSGAVQNLIKNRSFEISKSNIDFLINAKALSYGSLSDSEKNMYNSIYNEKTNNYSGLVDYLNKKIPKKMNKFTSEEVKNMFAYLSGDSLKIENGELIRYGDDGKEWGRGIKNLLEEVDNNSYDISGFNQTEISKKDYVHFSERLKQYNEEINSLDKNILVVRKSDFQFDNSLENIIKQKNYIPLETLYNDKEKRMAYIFYDSKERTYISYTPSTAVGTDKWHERDDLYSARVSAIEFLFNSEKAIMNKKDFSKLYDVIDVYGNILDPESYYDEIPMEVFNSDTAVEINRILSENEIDASITGVKFYGDGEFGKKVLVEYKGDISEDGLYNVLKQEGVVIEGEKLDCNPIKPDKSGTIEEYLSFQNSMNEAQNKNEEEKIVTESVTFPCGFTLSDKMDRSEMEKEELEMYSRLKAEFDFADNETSTGLFDGTDHNDPSYNINFSIPVPIEAQYPQSKTNEWVLSIEKKLVSKYGAFVSWEGGERTETCFKTKEGARRFAFDNSLLASITRREYDALSQLKLHKAPGEGEGFYNFMDRNSLLTFGILKFNGFEKKLLSEKTLDTSFYKSISIIPSDYRVSNLYRFALKDTDCLKKDFEEKIYSASKEDKISLDKKLADEFATLSINQEKVRELLRYGADPFSLEGRKCWLNAAADAELGDNLFWLLDNLGSSNIENLFKDKDFADKVYSIAKESVVNDRDSWTAKEDIGIDGLRHIAKLCGKDKELDTEKYYNQLLHDSGFQLYLIQGTVDFSDASDGFTQKDLDRMKNTGIKEDDAIKIAGNLGENIDNIGNALTPDGKEIARNDALLKLIDTCYIGTKDELLNNYNIPEYDCHGNSLFETANKSIDSQQKVTDRFLEKLNNLVPSNNTDIEVVLKAAQNALLGFNKEEKNLISKSFIEMGAEKNNFGDILNNALKTRKHSKRDVEKVHRNISRASDGIESL